MKRFMNPHQTIFLPHFFFGKPTNFSYLIFWVTHQFFLPHFLGKPTNFSYLIFLGNPPIFPTSFSWETHQFFLPHFFGNPPIFPTSFFWGKCTNFSYLIFLGNPPIFPTSFFGGNAPIFPTSFSWETHQFFLPHFFGKPSNLVNETLKETPPHEVFGYYLCYHLEFLQAFHNEGRYH